MWALSQVTIPHPRYVLSNFAVLGQAADWINAFWDTQFAARLSGHCRLPSQVTTNPTRWLHPLHINPGAGNHCDPSALCAMLGLAVHRCPGQGPTGIKLAQKGATGGLTRHRPASAQNSILTHVSSGEWAPSTSGPFPCPALGACAWAPGTAGPPPFTTWPAVCVRLDRSQHTKPIGCF